jgi:hypothetical protein
MPISRRVICLRRPLQAWRMAHMRSPLSSEAVGRLCATTSGKGSSDVGAGKVSFVDELATIRPDRRAAPFRRSDSGYSGRFGALSARNPPSTLPLGAVALRDR